MNTLAILRQLGRTSVLLLVLASAWLAPGVMAQEPPPRVGLVIVGAGDDPITACVSLEEGALTGLELLRAAGMARELNTEGAVCSLAAVGCPANDCFCECRGTPCRYWSYYHLDVDGTWAYSGVGAGAWSLRPGDVDGWVWGDGSQPPPALTFEDLCPPASATTPEAPSTLTTGGRATPIATPAADTTPETIYLPGIGGSQQRPEEGDLLTRVLAWLDEGYRGFILLLLALAALALLKWQPGKDDTESSP